MAITTVLLADNYPIFLEGLKAFLAPFPDIQVTACTQNGAAAWQLLQEQAFDLIILDLNLSEMNGLDLLAAIRHLEHPPKTLVFSMFRETKIVELAIRRGADAYLAKDTQLEELYIAIEEVMDGGFYLDESIHLHMPGFSLQEKESSLLSKMKRLYSLTRREGQVLSLIAATRTNREIADVLNISDQTVGVHRRNILRKFGVHNTSSLIRKVFEFERVN
ncbi:MAG: response regulator transcription factor [Bacteroidota bacterium]